MPYEWDDITKAPDHPGAFCFAKGGEPRSRLTLWPHRSMSNSGFAWFIGATFAMFLLPLLALVGSVALWGLLPFLLLALWAIWYSIRRNDIDRSLHEVLSVWEDRVELIRQNPRGPDQTWHANPHWVEVKMLADGGPVENYVTLRGNGRTVEIGAFLSAEERQELKRSLSQSLLHGYAKQ